MPCLNTSLHKYPNIYHTTPIYIVYFTAPLFYIFLFAHCVLLLLHVHCSPTSSIVLFGLMNKYYYCSGETEPYPTTTGQERNLLAGIWHHRQQLSVVHIRWRTQCLL